MAVAITITVITEVGITMAEGGTAVDIVVGITVVVVVVGIVVGIAGVEGIAVEATRVVGAVEAVVVMGVVVVGVKGEGELEGGVRGLGVVLLLR